MAPLGFVMVERSAGLDAAKCRVILAQLARLHGASLALRHLRPQEAHKLECAIKEVAFEKSNPIINEIGTMLRDCMSKSTTVSFILFSF